MSPAAGRRAPRIGLVADGVAVGLAALVATAFAVRALALIAYPYDWAPDEGLALDYARRLLVAPETLYARLAVPFPCAYTPLLPALLAPLVGAAAPLSWARCLAFAWTVAIAGSLFALVRRKGGLALAAASAALSLSLFDLTFWFMLVRVDGLMVALWIAGAVPLMPARLAAGADRLSPARLALGATLLMLSVLAKPTAVLHAAPLVLGWWLVDRRSAWRLGLALLVSGLGALVLLQWLTGGGFLWVMGLWTLHGTVPGQVARNLAFYASRTWPLTGAAVLGFGAAALARRSPWRDGTVLLLVGAGVAIPALAKAGAMWNYLLPLLLATGVAAGRWWGDAVRERAAGAAVAPILAGLAVAMALSRPFPLPGPSERETAAAFYDYVGEVAATTDGTVLAARPDFASWIAGNPVEVEATSFPFLVEKGVAGVERVRDRLRARAYPLVIDGPFFPPEGAGIAQALRENYVRFGGCHVPFFYGRTFHAFYAPGDRPIGTPPPIGRFCGLVAP